MKNSDIGEAYYKAMSEKNVEEAGKYLHPDVQFVAPLAVLQGKQATIEAAKRFVTLFNSLTIRAKLDSHDQAVIIYDLDCPAPIESFRAAAFMNIRNGLIERIELLFDARPFEKK